MAMTYRTRHALVSGVDVWYLASLEGTVTVGPIPVPVGMTKIVQISSAAGDSTPTAASRNHGLIAKMVGVNEGEAIVVLNGLTGTGVTGGNAGTECGSIRRDVEIPVTPGKVLSVYLCATGGIDTSAPIAGVTLGFSS
jgi:hypothetical protein